MKLLKLGPNLTEISYQDGTRVLVSYATPVAAWTPKDGGKWIKADHFYSRTTSAHVKKWLPEDYQLVNQVTPDAVAALLAGR